MITKQKIKKILIILVTMTIVSLLCVFHNLINPLLLNMLSNRFKIVSNKENLLVHFIDVEQADAVAINLPDNKTMLIDSGTKNFNVEYAKYLKENVVNSKFSNSIDYLVLTHADSDHVGGTMKLLKNFDVKMVFLPSVASTSQTYEELYSYVVENCEYQFLGDEFVLTNNHYEILFFKQLNLTNTNDSSQVVKLTYKSKSFLFTGDISSDVEEDYVSVYGDTLNSDVLKVSHHGGENATSNEFLQTVRPKYAVISVGENNNYGHPTYDVLSRLEENDVEILRTDEDGNILFVVGHVYDFIYLTDVFYITTMPLDYRVYILVLDILLFTIAIVTLIKKEKKKNKHLDNNFVE